MQQERQLHPDANVEPDAAERFNDLVAAYDVLSNHRTQREYDEQRNQPTTLVVAGKGSGVARPASVAPAPNLPIGARWSRRRAWTALLAGALVTILGLGAALLTWTLHENDARRHAVGHV